MTPQEEFSQRKLQRIKANRMIREAVKEDRVIARLRKDFQEKFNKRVGKITSLVWEKIRAEEFAQFKKSCRELGIPLLPPVPKVDYGRKNEAIQE